jgi:hypothetical protein
VVLDPSCVELDILRRQGEPERLDLGVLVARSVFASSVAVINPSKGD